MSKHTTYFSSVTKKTFYTFLALGAMITIGVAAAGFISADTATETTVENPTPVTGTWIAGKVSADGEKLSGTGSWNIKELPGGAKMPAGRYYIESSSGNIVTIVGNVHDAYRGKRLFKSTIYPPGTIGRSGDLQLDL